MATEVLMPRQGQSVESCILVEWLVKEGDKVTTGQPLASIETDKAVFEVESPADGIMLAQFFPAGDDIPVLTVIGAIGAAGEDVAGLRPDAAGAPAVAAPAASAPAPAVEAAPVASASAVVASAPPVGTGAHGVSPRARKRAAETGVAVDGLAGTGPGGRVLARDVEQAAAGQPRLSASARAAAGGQSVPAVGSGPGGMVLAGDLGQGPVAVPARVAAADREIPVKGIRKVIATRMRESLAGTAQITLNKSFDATALLAYRERIKQHAETLGLPNITINDLIAYACVRMLQQHPALNAHFLGDRIVEKGAVNLGIATDTERGLMVPVVVGAEQLSLRQLSETIKPLAKACQSGSINPDLLQGGTFTITNLGILGVESFTPVLNVPEVAILGVNGLMVKPVMQADGSVKHVQAINLSLTVDHQAVDGAPAARFLKDLCTALEQVDLLLMG